jgi:CRISPR-associated protein Cmr4
VVLEDLAVAPMQDPPQVAVLQELFESLAPQINRLLLISDQNFSFLVRTATEVQPQIKIDIDTGITVDGSLRYQELLPTDTVLYSLVFFAQERIGNKKDALVAEVVRNHLINAISTHIQMGGDMTLGRGMLAVRWLPENNGQGGA